MMGFLLFTMLLWKWPELSWKFEDLDKEHKDHWTEPW